MNTKWPILKRMVSVVVLILAVPISTTKAGDVYWDDGGSYLINDETYKPDYVHLDYNIANDPGTHLDLVEGGVVGMLGAYHNATIDMTGGRSDFISCHDLSIINVSGGTAPLRAYDTCIINISGGYVGAEAWDYSVINIYDGANVGSAGAINNGHINIYGGNINRVSASYYDATIDIYGGNIHDSINASDNSEVNVYGYDLVLSPTGGTAGYGTIVGYLQDGTPINVYLGNPETYLHINLVPEPSILSLFAIGFLSLSRKKTLILTKF